MDVASNPIKIAEMPDKSRRNTHMGVSNMSKEETDPVDSDSLGAVVASCQQGNRLTQRQLYDLCHQSIFRLAARIVGWQDAVDVTQEIFLQIFRSIGLFNGKSRFETWMYRLAVNESLQYLRRMRRWRNPTLDWEPMDDKHPEENAERKELLELALLRIDPELRAIFLLREVEGLSYQDIAKALQIPEGTVGSRLNRARRELQKILTEFGFEI